MSEAAVGSEATGVWRGHVVHYGDPASQGSKRIGRVKATGKPIVLDCDGRLKPWRTDLSLLMQACRPEAPLAGAVEVTLTVYASRPGYHYGRVKGERGKLLPWAVKLVYAVAGRDLDKVQRAVGDAGTGVWWSDDRKIARWVVERLYTEGAPRIEVTARALDEAAG